MENEDITLDNENVSCPYNPSTSNKQRTPCEVYIRAVYGCRCNRSLDERKG